MPISRDAAIVCFVSCSLVAGELSRRRRAGGRGRRAARAGKLGGGERELDGRLVKIALEIYRDAGHLHAEQVVDFILVKDGAEIDRTDARQMRLFAGQRQAQIGKLAVEVEAVGQLDLAGQLRGADLHQPAILGLLGPDFFQQRVNRDQFDLFLAHLRSFCR